MRDGGDWSSADLNYTQEFYFIERFALENNIYVMVAPILPESVLYHKQSEWKREEGRESERERIVLSTLNECLINSDYSSIII